MTAATLEAASERLYFSPLGLFDFQAEGIVDAYVKFTEQDRDFLAIWDTGIGKTHLAMALAAMLFEDGLIDHCLVACESEKLTEWIRDFGKFTRLDTAKYHGTTKQRAKIREAMPSVLVSTYETFRTDFGKCERRGNRKWPILSGPLLPLIRGRRILFVYDECTKLKERSSGTHIMHQAAINEVRGTHGRAHLLGLTATPVEHNDEDFYNLGRIWTPSTVPTVEAFHSLHVSTWDDYQRPKTFHNQQLLVGYLAPVVHRKRKTDADVKDQFPKRVEEEPTYVDLDAQHRSFYDDVEVALLDTDPKLEKSVVGVMRMIAGYPRALVNAEGKVAQEIVAAVGEAGLTHLGSTKRDRLIQWLRPIVAQGDQAIVFTFFGPTMIPFLADDLTAAGYHVLTNHSEMPRSQREANKLAFREGEGHVFLTSDAGSRGLNFPNATYVHHYEYPGAYSRYVQRSDRIHRIDSAKASVTISGMVVRNSVEDGMLSLMLSRNKISDQLVDHDAVPDEDFMTSAQRRALLKRAKG